MLSLSFDTYDQELAILLSTDSHPAFGRAGRILLSALGDWMRGGSIDLNTKYLLRRLMLVCICGPS